MLKIKGLKKKKKGKKSKHKEEELFEAAELEQYRREHQLKEAEGDTGDKGNNEESEEWKKFKALTSGVDDILKKTQGDLDRIKSTSFFQRKPPGPSTSEKQVDPAQPVKVAPPTEKKWINFEEGSGFESDNPEEVKTEPTADVSRQDKAFEVEVEKPEEEEEEETEEDEDQDDIFDTSYVDVVASGEVKLAYIPDSPIQEETGFDPFDTSIVEKVIKFDPNEKKRNLVSLGSAVEVLTGKVEKPDSVSQAKRRRPRAQDLLLGSFDEDQVSQIDAVPVEAAPKSILDEDPIFAEETSAVIGFPPVTPVVENKPIFSVADSQEKPNEKAVVKEDLITEFIPSFSTSAVEDLVQPVIQDDLDDEFTALAAESVSKEIKEVKKEKPPRPAPPPQISKTADVCLSDDDLNLEDDPFDTSFASKVLPGKFELKLIEKEILDNEIPVATVQVSVVQEQINEVLKKSTSTKLSWSENFDEHNFLENDQELLSLKHRDLLGGSTSDLSTIAHSPIKPEARNSLTGDLSYCDPFDTSGIDVLAAPGKTELKFLEKELLTQALAATCEEVDEEFDPRAEEAHSKPNRPDQLPLDNKRISIPKVVAFDVKSPSNRPDLLAVGQEEDSKVSKPLTPYYPNSEVDGNSNVETVVDPFDTSFVSNRPGKVELKLLESELVGQTELKRKLSDPDFNPRDSEPLEPVESQTFTPGDNETLKPDIFSQEEEVGVKLHTPVLPRKIQEAVPQADIDPFDTSIANDLFPGKVEIKLIENELNATTEPPLSATNIAIALKEQPGTNESKNHRDTQKRESIDVLSVHSDDNITEKPLTPLVASTSFDADDIDPFDTSIVGDILPGKTELKLLESELMSN